VKALRVDAASYIPVSVQLKEQLRQLIDRGSLPPGSKLPSVRELAGFLRINRNTVLRALAELEREGYLRREQGRGIFVRPHANRSSVVSVLNQLVDETLARATDLGVAPDALAVALLSQPTLVASDSQKARILLVECNRPALRLYTAELSRELDVSIEPVLVAELRNRASELEFVDRYRIVVTTLFHVEEVQAICAPHGLSVLGLLPQASLSTLSRLVALPSGTALGIICEDREGIENMLESLRRAGINRLRLIDAAIDDSQRLNHLLDAADLVVTTRECASQVRNMVPEVEVIVEDGGLDRSGIELLRRMLEVESK
jgi:GntR family transcriptional regulator